MAKKEWFFEKHPQLGGTDLMPVAHLLHMEEIAKGFVNGRNEGPNADDQVIALVRKNKKGKREILALITYTYRERGKYLWITGSWTAEDHRREGFHSYLFKRLVKIAREMGAYSIDSLVHVKNAPMLAAAKKQGRVIEQHNLIYYI